MKKMRKIFALLIAMVMVLSMGTSVFAATITINSGAANGQTASDTTEYTYYQLLNASIDGEKVAYYLESTEKDGLAFLLDQVTVDGSDLFTVEKSADGNRWIVTINKKEDGTEYTDADGEKIATALNTEAIKSQAIATEIFSMNNGSAIAEVDPGYFLITSSLGTKLAIQTLKDVTITEKNSYPGLTKSDNIDDKSVSYGQVITYTVPVTIPETVAEKEIKIIDTMTKGLTPVDSDDEDTLMDITVTTTKEDGTASATVSAATVDAATGAQTITITIPADVVKANAGETITVTYKATVNAEAVVNVAEGNEAHLEYDNFKTVDTPEVTVTVYGFEVTKKDGMNTPTIEDDEDLEVGDAEFSLWNEVTGGTQIKVVIKDEETNTYRVALEDEIGVAIKAGESGKAIIEGLALGEYYLQEDKAPDGYNRLTERVKVEVKAGVTSVSAIDVANNAGSILPSTGGMGTTILYVVGGILVVAAVVLLFVKRRVEEN